MAEYREVRYERLYVKIPGSDQLRRRAAGRLKHMLATGWRETERAPNAEYIRVRLERTSPVPRNVKIKEPPPPPPRPRREGGFRGGPGGGGGFRGGPGGGGGFRGGPGGGGPRGAPGAPGSAPTG
jgi:hypothetical protein